MENPTPPARPDRPDEASSPLDVADSGSTGAEGDARAQHIADDGTEAAPGYADWRPDPYGRAELRRFFLGRATSVVRTGDSES
ncbi:MAG TPA: hypothetical protein VMB72_04900, partial [Acidimicrobiales bacterium]|nr:hypothetical protein [Acidimicrobiales bacterium]